MSEHDITVGMIFLISCQTRFHPPQAPIDSDPSAAWEEVIELVSSENGVDYVLLNEHKDILDLYISWIAEHGPREDRMSIRQGKKRLAFFINAYNASVLYALLEQPDLESVQDLSQGVFPSGGAGFFLGQEFKIDGEWVSLFFLEQQYILGNFQDPVIHAALNCGSKGCPQLRYFKEKGLDDQMEDALKAFLNSDVGSQAPENADEPWRVSEIFFWYEKDFTEWSLSENLCEYLRPYAKGELSYWLEGQAGQPCLLRSFPYDWSLNKTVQAPQNSDSSIKKTPLAPIQIKSLPKEIKTQKKSSQ